MVTASHRNEKAYLITFLVISIVEVLLVSGITYGWASIVDVFRDEGFFQSLCDINQTDSKSSGQLNGTHHRSVRSAPSGDHDYTGTAGCRKQNERLNLVFTIAVFSLCGVTFMIGAFVDKFGPRASRFIGCIIYVVSGVGLAFASKERSDILFPVFIGFCVGGTFIAIAIYQVTSLLFDRVKSLVLCILHGTFDSSAVILLLFKIAYDSGFQLKQISLTYTVICFVIVLPVTFLLIPSKSVAFALGQEIPADIRQSMHGLNYVGVKLANYSAEILEDSVMSTKEDKRRILERRSLALELDLQDNVTEAVGNNVDHNIENSESLSLDLLALEKLLPSKDSVWKAFKSLLFTTDLFFLSVVQLRLWFFIGTFSPKLKLLTNNNQAEVDKYVEIFGYAQLCGIAVAPLIGLVFDKGIMGCGPKEEKEDDGEEIRTVRRIKGSILPFSITLFLAVAFCALTLVKSSQVIIPCCILHVVVRGFLYSDHAAFVGTAFTPKFFGRLYGLGIFLSGVFGLLQYPLFVIMESHFDGDPYWIDVALLVMVALGCIQPIYVAYFSRKALRRIKQHHPKTLQ